MLQLPWTAADTGPAGSAGTGSCPWRGRSPSPRAASSRRGSASGRSSARHGRPGGSRSGPAGPPVALGADPTEDRSADHLRALAKPSRLHRLRVELEHARRVRRLEGLVAPALVSVALAAELGPVDVVGALGKRVEALGRPSVLTGPRFASAFVVPGRRAPRSRVAPGRDELEVVGAQLATLGHRVELVQLAEPGVGVAVAERVLEHDVVAPSRREYPTQPTIAPSLTATTGLHAGEDVDPATGRRGGDHVGGVAVLRRALRGRFAQPGAVGDVVGVAGAGGDREVGAVGEPGQRADQVGGQLAVRRA